MKILVSCEASLKNRASVGQPSAAFWPPLAPLCGLLAPSAARSLLAPSAAFWPPRRPGGVKRRYGSPPSNSPQHSGSVSVVGVVRIVLTRRRGSADMKKRKSVEIHEHRYSKQVQKAVDIDRNL